MLDLLSELPWWLAPAVALVAAVLVVSGFRQAKPMRRNIGLAVLALAVVVTLLGYFVESDQRKVENRTRRLVEAVGKQDWPTVNSILSPTTVLAINNGGELPRGGRDQIVAVAQAGAAYYGLQSASVTTIEATQNDTIITVNIDVEASAALASQGVPSSWALDWAKSGKDWELDKITCIRTPAVPLSNFWVTLMNQPRQGER
jgi:hypothetical protein